MARMSRELNIALNSFCGHSFESVLTAHKPEDFETLQTHLEIYHSIRPDVRQRVLYLLGKWGSQESAESIIRLLPNLGETELMTAITALGDIGTPEVFPAILEYKDDPSADVRRFVVLALSKINTDEALAELKAIAASDQEPYIQEKASKLLHSSSKYI